VRERKVPEVVVPDEMVAQWQGLVSALADLSNTPSCLVMRIDGEDIEVFAASCNQGNPYRPGDREHLLNSGLYCETVVSSKRPLHVPDALSDPEWQANPDVKLGMVAYLGLPILFPDGTPFGTICLLDSKPTPYGEAVRTVLDGLCSLIESHLAVLYMNAALGEKNADLLAYLDELQALRGLIAICCQCKRIRDPDGAWNPVETYLVRHPGAEFTHGYCPECYERAMREE